VNNYSLFDNTDAQTLHHLTTKHENMELHTFYLTFLYTLLSPLLSDSPTDPVASSGELPLFAG
jgi:hypothetical protein